MNCFAFLIGLATSTAAAIDIFSDHTGNIFVDNEPVRFHIKNSADANLSIINYEGEDVFERSLPTGESMVEMGVLPKSHYTIIVRSGDEVKEIYFGVVPSPESRPRLEDSNIASDLAMSWLVKPDRFNDLAKLTKLSGITWVRDRISWGEIEPQRGILPDSTRYDLSAETQAGYGLKVYQVFHDTPGWAQKDGVSKSFPDDLRDAYNFAAEMARRFKGKVAAWEVWNEPDIIQFSDELGDAYSALLKAMYLGFKSADPEIPVLICSFAMEPGRFAEDIFQNDVGNYFDIYNYHIYDRWENHTSRALKHIGLMQRYGLEKPVWLTEAGHAVKRLPDLVEVTRDQGREVAEFLPKAIVSSLAAGVDKYFWFIMPYYRESDVMLFGLLRADMTPTAGYCAMTSCAYALGKAEYLGKLDLADIHAHAFLRGDDNVVVTFWTDAGERDFSLRAEVKSAILANLMGYERKIDALNGFLTLKAVPSVNYVILPANALKDELKMNYPRRKPEIRPYDPQAVSPFVLRLQFPRESRDKKSDTYLIPAGTSAKVGLEVYNFGNISRSFRLVLHFPEGWEGALDNEEVSIGHKERVIRELEIKTGSEPGWVRVDLMNDAGKAETFIIARIGVK